MPYPRFPLPMHKRSTVPEMGRLVAIAIALAAVAAVGVWIGSAEAHPSLSEMLQAPQEVNTLRVHGYPVVSNPDEPAHANRPATAGSNSNVDPRTRQIPEDPEYRNPAGPFDPFVGEAPEMDFVTWDPAWISERLNDPALQAEWPGLVGEDEVSRGAHIEVSGSNGSEKVWLRHWYEPQHLDLDLNADSRLTDRDNNGIPDAPPNPAPSNIDEWYAAVMTELTYMLVDNDPLPMAEPLPSELHQSAPRPICGTAGDTSIVFPIGIAESELDPAGPEIGYGLTSLDADFDGQIDMVRLTDEQTLPNEISGTEIDFDGDGVLDTFDTNGFPLTCDEMVVAYTEALTVGLDDTVQFLDHYIQIVSVTGSAAVVEVFYTGDLVPRSMGQRSLGIESLLLAGDSGPLETLAAGDTNLGTVPTGPWFAYLQDADPSTDETVLIVGRALGASCASMTDGAGLNRRPGGPAFLKRFYVDGHEFNVVAIGSCSATEFQYITLRAPLPKPPEGEDALPVPIEAHSVRLQSYPDVGTYPAAAPAEGSLPLPPPFNYEHTILEDVLAFDVFEDIEVPPDQVPPFSPRPQIRYMGGPIGPVSPVLGHGEGLPYAGRDPSDPVGPHNDVRAARWFYMFEDTNPQMIGQLREKLGAARRAGALDVVFASFRNENLACFNEGDGFDRCTTVDASAFTSTAVDLGDVNGDGYLDAVFASDGAQPGQPNRVCINDGLGTFICTSIDLVLRQTSGVALGDVNGDGFVDAVFSNLNRGNRACLGDGAGAFACTTIPTALPAFPQSSDVALGDVDGDGNVDAVFANRATTLGKSICLGDGAGAFTCTRFDGATDSYGVAVGDMNNDGDLDAMFANLGQRNQICIGNGAGGFSCSAVSSDTLASRAVAVADINLDGNLDAVIANSGAGPDRNRLCLGNGLGAFSCGDLTNDRWTSYDVALGDIDDDGRIDAVFANMAGANQYCLNRGAAGFVCDAVSSDVDAWYGVALGNLNPRSRLPQDAFFYNEQVWTMPWNFTEFVLPDHPDPAGAPQAYDADKYHFTSAFTAPTARWRRWTMPDGPVAAQVPPAPPDLTENVTPDGGFPTGDSRRATFWFDPDDPSDVPVKLWTDDTGVRLFGGQPERENFPCDPNRPGLSYSSGDRGIASDATSVELGLDYPVEVFPYTDPWAPFNPQHPHATRGDSLTANPAYMDEFRNFNEPLQDLYRQLSNDTQNSREKVYHRMWYEPDYISKIRDPFDCDRDIRFPALMQEFTYLYVDTTDNPSAAPPGRSRFGFPIGTGARELPVPEVGGTLPSYGEFGYGLTTFDSNFDDSPEAVTVHTEATLNAYLDTQWQTHRPTLPGIPILPINGPALDFDGDGITDTLDADTTQLNGNELVVFAVESVTLDLDPLTPAGSSAMMLDHLVTLDNVTPGARAQFHFWYTGGNDVNAMPRRIGGVRSLNVGDAAIADRNRVTIVGPGETNPGTDGGWFVFLDDVSGTENQVTVTVGRALGATHSAIDDASGGHDLLPGDPWYLKRFYVDGHEYNVVAVMTQPGPVGEDDLFQFITIRTPVPKGNVFNAQDSLFQQGYFLDQLPPEASVMPPFNVDHTIAEDVERLTEEEFANSTEYDECVGGLAPFGPLDEIIIAETTEARLGVELEEIYAPRRELDATWQTDQSQVIPNQYTDVSVSEDQLYLLTSNWRSPVSRLHFYGCLRQPPPPFPPGIPALTHDDVAAAAAAWDPAAWQAGVPRNIVPLPNQRNPAQPYLVLPPLPPIISDYFDARLGGRDPRVKIFYDPTESTDIYFNRRTIITGEVPTETPTAIPSATGTVATATDSPTETETPVASPPTATPTATVTLTPAAGTGGAPTNVSCTVVSSFRIQVDWTDNSDFETEFIIEVSVEGSPYAPVEIISSTTQGSTGTPYSYTTPVDLAADTGYQWRVIARDPGVPISSPPSLETAECRTASVPLDQLGCYKGKIYLQGRTDHAGTLIYIDGIPMGSTDSRGEFCICDILAGKHTLSTQGACYLSALASNVPLKPGMTTVMPFTALKGGDVNNDSIINLFDMVRVGRDYRSSPPNDPGADCTADDSVDLFDLVLVGTNYGISGPMPWGPGPVSAQSQDDASEGGQDLVEPVARTFEPELHGAPESPEVAASLRSMADDELVVDVTAHGIRQVYGAELRLEFDPARLQVVDVSETPGVQIQPGDEWVSSGSSFIKPNTVDNEAGTILFAASRLNPAAALEGDVVLATVTFRPVADPADDAFALSGVLLIDRWANEIETKWEGVDIEPVNRLPDLIASVFLPYAANMDE